MVPAAFVPFCSLLLCSFEVTLPTNRTVQPSLLLTSLSDAHNVTGLLTARGSTLATVPGGIRAPYKDNATIAIYAGILPNSTYELFTVEPPPLANASDQRRSIFRYLSLDLKTYSPPYLVLRANLTSAAMAQNGIDGSYMLVVFQTTPSHIQSQSTSTLQSAFVYKSRDGLAWTPTKKDKTGSALPAYSGAYGSDSYSATGLLYHPDPKVGWLSTQRILQPLPKGKPKPFPDDIGANSRRVISVMASQDNGETWSKPDDTSLLLPDPKLDPPELVFLFLQCTTVFLCTARRRA